MTLGIIFLLASVLNLMPGLFGVPVDAMTNYNKTWSIKNSRNFSSKRIVLPIGYNHIDFLLEIISVAAFVISIALIIHYWPVLPEEIPRHFNLSGEADGWGAKSGIFDLPVISFFLYLFMTVIRNFPHYYNFPWEITPENAARQYRLAVYIISCLKATVLILFAYLNWMTIRVALGQSEGLGWAMLPLALLFTFVPIVLFTYLAYKNR